jgi:hypothetical protein
MLGETPRRMTDVLLTGVTPAPARTRRRDAGLVDVTETAAPRAKPSPRQQFSGDTRSVEEGPERFVVVPRRAGEHLVPLAQARTQDDVDALVDDLLGEDTTKGPGVADAVLLAAGMGLVAWGAVAGVVGLIVVGIVVTLLGVVLPLRWAWQQLQRRRSEHAVVRAGGRAALLDVTAGTTAELVAAYEQIIGSAQPDEDAPQQAALLAVLEVASLLDGRRPAGEAEVEYVRTRSEALRRLQVSLAARPVRTGNEELIEARNELDLLTATGSLAQIESLVEQYGTDGR